MQPSSNNCCQGSAQSLKNAWLSDSLLEDHGYCNAEGWCSVDSGVCFLSSDETSTCTTLKPQFKERLHIKESSSSRPPTQLPSERPSLARDPRPRLPCPSEARSSPISIRPGSRSRRNNARTDRTLETYNRAANTPRSHTSASETDATWFIRGVDLLFDRYDTESQKWAGYCDRAYATGGEELLVLIQETMTKKARDEGEIFYLEL
ncbi:hypothetical protein FALBO_7404 [Fusarium albosuccineum]|uniref:Uncharacterized protein n=1 Tax=Fusarium albosuccineum TaxID=1237068 RepID=A0A8H4LCY0_9HYPO|nr:hypothetical protein FALBO_7404 [Fusarium albosuccineum]